MVTLVIYGMIAIALAASAGYAFLTFTSTSRQMTQLQENQVRMDTAVAALRASLLGLSGNGVSYAPLGVLGAAPNAYMQLPSSLGVVGASPWGQPYLYCPVSLTGASNSYIPANASSVQSPSSATYAVGIYSNTITTQGNNYVVTSVNPTSISTAHAPGYVAFIVSTLGPGQQMPDCSAITISTGGPQVAGGTVRGVTAGFSFLQRVNSATDRMELYVGGAATGDGTGRDVFNQNTMDGAMAMWQALQPRLCVIYLESNVTTSSNFTAPNLALDDMQGQNASLLIETDPQVYNALPGPVKLTLNSATTLSTTTTFQDVNLVGVSLGTTTPMMTAYKPLLFRNVHFTTTTSSNGLLNVVDTTMRIEDTNNSVYGTGAGLANVAINATGSKLDFLRYSVNGLSVGPITAVNSTINIADQVNTGNGIGFTGNLTLYSSTMTVGNVALSNNQGITMNGQMYLANSSLEVLGTNTTFQIVYGAGPPPLWAVNSNIHVVPGATLNLANLYTSEGLLAIGSHISLDGTLSFASQGGQPNYGAIASVESTITGNGGTITSYNGACVDILPSGFTRDTNTVSILKGSTSSNGYPAFNQLKGGTGNFLGYPALKTPYLVSPASAQDQTVASSLTTANNNQPVVTGGTVTAGNLNPYTAYVDPTTLEAAIRTVVNGEYLAGTHLNVSNLTCN